MERSLGGTARREPQGPRPLSLTLALFGTGFVAATILIYAGALELGRHLKLAGASLDETPVTMTIAGHRFAFPSNAIRFPEQRSSGAGDVDLYLTWPELGGFSLAASTRFYAEDASEILFLRLAPAEAETGIRPRQAEAPQTRPSGIAGLKRLGAGDALTGQGEIGLIAEGAGGSAYRVTCLDESAAELMAADCIRETTVAPGLAFTYRFSQKLLPQWQTIDAAVTAYVAKHAVGTAADGEIAAPPGS